MNFPAFCRRLAVKSCIIGKALAKKFGMPFTKPLLTLSMSARPRSRNVGIMEPKPLIKRGKMSINALTTLSVACSTVCANSSPPIVPVRKFFQAAFMEFTEPSIVPLASAAVAPAIFMLSCITEIALMMLSKLMLSASTVTPRRCIESSICEASLIRRCISSFVPP